MPFHYLQPQSRLHSIHLSLMCHFKECIIYYKLLLLKYVLTYKKKSHKWCKNHENIKSFHNSYWHKLTAKMNSHTWILQTIWINYSTHLHLKKWCCWPVVHVSTVLGVDWLYSTLCLHRILSAKFLYLSKKTLWTVQFAFFELPVDLISLWCPVLVVWFRKMGN